MALFLFYFLFLTSKSYPGGMFRRGHILLVHSRFSRFFKKYVVMT